MTNNILYCVLNWGLGHASRSVPIIKDLIHQGHSVSLASDGIALDLLQKEFPNLQTFNLPPYGINYKYDSIVINLLSQFHKLFKAIRTEKKEVACLVKEHGFNQIISDNRFGCYQENCKNVIITHQIRLIHPNRFIQASGSRMNMALINKFDECWVPDSVDPPGLSGDMSHNIDLKIPIKFIGIQSRFSKSPQPLNYKYKTISIISGPEPQRSNFQEALLHSLKDITGPHLIVTGKSITDYKEDNFSFVGLKTKEELELLLNESDLIISRSGYSSLMDYEAMERKAILVPTPGQSEQEYLAVCAGIKNRHIVLNQDHLDLKKVIH